MKDDTQRPQDNMVEANPKPPLQHPRRPHGRAPPSRRQENKTTTSTWTEKVTRVVKGLYYDASKNERDT
jgi:hypothetical protein